MFAKICAFILVVTYTAAEIPSYIHICGRKDPKIDQCILNNINNLKNKICKGIPELDVPSIDSFILDKLVIFDTSNIKLYMRNAEVTGLCDFKINYFHIDIDNQHYDFELVFNRIRINSTYDFDIRLLVPIVHKGYLYTIADNVEAKINTDWAIMTKDDKRYMYLSKIKINLDIKKYSYQFDIDKEQRQLCQIIHDFVGKNQEEILKKLKPVLEETIAKQVLSISNNIVKHFTYDELFPDRI